MEFAGAEFKQYSCAECWFVCGCGGVKRSTRTRAASISIQHRQGTAEITGKSIPQNRFYSNSQVHKLELTSAPHKCISKSRSPLPWWWPLVKSSQHIDFVIWLFVTCFQIWTICHCQDFLHVSTQTLVCNRRVGKWFE